MFFITKIVNIANKYKYTVYDVKTDSTIEVFGEVHNKFNSRGLRVSNKEALNWDYNLIITSGDGQAVGYYLLVSIIDGEIYKLVSQDGNTTSVQKEKAIQLIEKGRLINCKVTNNSIESTDDIWVASTNAEFKSFIEAEYKKYQAKSKLIGQDSRFYINTIGNDVRVLDYQGTSDSIIMPNFITTINKEAFKKTKTKHIKLNEGLKFIGAKAFMGCKINNLVIPNTVDYIYKSALIGNRDLYTSNNKIIDKDKVTINVNTILI